MMTITVEDHATPALRQYMASLRDRRGLHAAMAMGVERKVLRHLREVKMPQGNQFGAPSTGFWKKAMDSVRAKSDGAGATVSIRSRGVALQYYGGTIRPKNKNWLTIPAATEAHGKRAAEVAGGYANQQWLFNRSGKPYAIGERIRMRNGIQTHGRVLFWLKKKATIKPHPDVLPDEGAMAAEAVRAAEIHMEKQAV